MAEDGVDESKLTGFSRFFNSQTIRGRANAGMITYATVGLLVAYFMLRPKKAKNV